MSSDERLLRIIPNDINFYNPKLDQPVLRTAFAPNKSDSDGLSMYREDFVSVAALARWYASRRSKGCYIALLTADDILRAGFRLSFTIQPAPDKAPDPPGHVLIPQFTFDGSKKNARLARDIQLELAQLAQSRIVYYPPSPPHANS